MHLSLLRTAILGAALWLTPGCGTDSSSTDSAATDTSASDTDTPDTSDTSDTSDTGTNGIAQGVACTSTTTLEAGISVEASECASGFCGGVVCTGGVVSVCLGTPCACEVDEACVGFTNPASNRCVPADVCDTQ